MCVSLSYASRKTEGLFLRSGRDRIRLGPRSQLYDLYELAPRWYNAEPHLDGSSMADTLAAGNLTFNPLYKEVKIRLTRSLAAGEWKAGEAIPSESRLAQQFNVSI